MNHSNLIPKTEQTSTRLEILLPLLTLISGTILFLLTDLDLDISRAFYDEISRSWWMSQHPVINFSYVFGPFISAAVAFLALFQLMAAYVIPHHMHKRAVSSFILLAMVISLILVNGIMKESWRRPRPRDVVEFHGGHEFKKVLIINLGATRLKSFPSGHASSGFILVLFYFLLKKKRPQLAVASLAFAVALGIWLGIVRIAGGGHFASDILWAFGANWFATMILYYKWFLPYQEKLKKRPEFKRSLKRYLIIFIILLLGMGIISFRFLYSIPLDVHYEPQVIELPAHLKQIDIKMRAEKGDLNVHMGKPGQIVFQTWIKGHGLPNFKTDRQLTVNKDDRIWQFEYSVKPDGLAYEYQSHNQVYIPPGIKINWDLVTKLGDVNRNDLKHP